MSAQDTLKQLSKELKEKGDKEALARLQDLHKLYDGEDKVVSSKELEEELGKLPPEPKMYTGLSRLDETLDGFRPSQLITLTGITKHGKTTFAMELVERLKAENPLVLPFEEPAEELIRKYQERDMEVPLFYTPTNTNDRYLEWIESRILESKAKYDSKIVFIDHLDYIGDVSSSQGENETIRVKRVMQELKSIAKRLDIIVVLLVHLKKVQLDKNPTLEDIRGSAAISQESDTVMIMWRKTERNSDGEVVISNDAVLSIQANRRTGKTANIHLTFMDGRFLQDDEAELEATAKLANLEEVERQWKSK